MLPDVIDEFYITYGEHKDAIFYSFYVFFNKLATGLAVASSQIALQWVCGIFNHYHLGFFVFLVNSDALYLLDILFIFDNSGPRNCKQLEGLHYCN